MHDTGPHPHPQRDLALQMRDRNNNLRRFRRAPQKSLWQRIYHDYGLKRISLFLLLFAYQIAGAAVIYYCEHSNELNGELQWQNNLQRNRSALVRGIVAQLFNNTEFLFFLTAEQSQNVENELTDSIVAYEHQLGIRFEDHRVKWDFWNAMLYAQMICTTIGGGFAQLYPATTPGRVFTMVYACFGIPLVLAVLDDLGRILTRCLKTPWWAFKCCCRRLFRCITKQSIDEIRRLDAEERRDLELFDLPIPIAILVVIAWICLCSATFCIWERDWNYLVAFYFFFISLSTIGLGDIHPTQPKYLILLFFYIIIGLSLVSMCINLIQTKLESMHRRRSEGRSRESTPRVKRNPSSLGILRGSSYAQRNRTLQNLDDKPCYTKSSQTLLSFPSPTRKNIFTVDSKGYPRSFSIDDVMKLVDTEEGDILLLAELMRDTSTLSEISEAVRSDDMTDSSQQVVVSKSFETAFQPQSLSVLDPVTLLMANPRHSAGSKISNCPSATPLLPELLDLEAFEELEDRLVLCRSASYDANPSVQFRSRLSLIMENQGTIQESDESCPRTSKSSTQTSISSNFEDPGARHAYSEGLGSSKRLLHSTSSRQRH